MDGGAEVRRGKIYKLVSDTRGAKDSFQLPLRGCQPSPRSAELRKGVCAKVSVLDKRKDDAIFNLAFCSYSHLGSSGPVVLLLHTCRDGQMGQRGIKKWWRVSHTFRRLSPLT